DVGNQSAPTLIPVAQKRTIGGVPLAGLQIWVKADAGVVKDSNNLVSQWQDQSGQANTLVQPTLTSEPAWVANAVNGLPALHFDGSSDFLTFTNRLTNVRTVFWVIREDPAATAGIHLLLGDSSKYDFYSGSGHELWSSAYTSSAILNGQTWINGTPVDG